MIWLSTADGSWPRLRAPLQAHIFPQGWLVSAPETVPPAGKNQPLCGFALALPGAETEASVHELVLRLLAARTAAKARVTNASFRAARCRR
jgi:hypothetical protein